VGGLLAILLAIVGALYWYAETRLEREAIPALETEDLALDLDESLTFLVIGSDSREGMTDEERRELRVGDFDHEQADTILVVQVHPGDEEASIVSIPRDLLVTLEGENRRINAALGIGGPDLLVRTVEDLSGVKIDHYVEISLIGFVNVVDAIGTVEICIDEPLRDEKSGADFSAGCHDMDGVDALAYVRSREDPRGDFKRMDRQHNFLSAVMDELTAARTLVDLPRLFRIIDAGAPHVRTDEAIGLQEMRRLAEELRGVVEGEVKTAAVPAFAQDVNGIPVMIAYEPGMDELFSALRDREPIPPRGSLEQRQDTRVGVWTANLPEGAERIHSTLFFTGFEPEGLGAGPIEARASTVVYTIEDEEAAEWVAATLGAAKRTLPQDIEVPAEIDVLVVVGRDSDFEPAHRTEGEGY
jgi:LCP family protein required for cell wall assembly